MKTRKTWWWIAGIFVFMIVFLGMPQTEAQAAYKVKYDKNIQDKCLTNGKYIYYLATGRIDGKSQHILYRMDRNYQNKTIISTFCSAREEEDRKTLEDVNANNYSVQLVCYKNGKITLLTGDVELEFGSIDVKSGKYKMIVSGRTHFLHRRIKIMSMLLECVETGQRFRAMFITQKQINW